MNMQPDDDERVELSMAPLIDCVFLLLIFFLVTTMLKKDRKEIDVALPVSGSSLEMPLDDASLVIGIDREGALHWEGQPTTVQILIEKLREVERTTPDRRIRLDTDEATPFHRVVEVLDALQFRNLRNVGVRTYHEKYDR
jgi:biopolymer transport protein ExbD